MTIATSSDDAPQWLLYDDDFTTVLHILNGYDNKLYLRLNDTGSGELTIPVTDAATSDIAVGQFIALNYRGAYRGGFLVENIDKTEISKEEYAGQALTISGRGPMALLDDAIVWDWNTPGTEYIRKFGTNDVTSSDGGAPVPKGLMMYELLDEARNLHVNPYGQRLDRFCWRIGGTSDGTVIFDWDFDQTSDSSSVAWTDTEDMEFVVGASHLEIMRQIAELQYDFTITFASGVFTLHAYNDRIGSNLAGLCYFRSGMNCMEVKNTTYGAEVKNGILVGFSHPTVPYLDVKDDYSIIKYRRRESLLQAADANSSDTAEAFGLAELAKSKNPVKDHLIKVSDAVSPAAFVDYSLGDTVTVDAGTPETMRIVGMELDWDKDRKYADITLEVTDNIGWWLSGGISPNDCIAAYQPYLSNSLADSYTNLANPGTYDCTTGTAPDWSSSDGWKFTSTDNMYLDTGIILTSDGGTIIAKFDSLPGTTDYTAAIFGEYTTDNDIYSLPQTIINTRYYYYAEGNLSISGNVTNGVIAISGGYCYLNGTLEGVVSDLIAKPFNGTGVSIFIGANNNKGAMASPLTGNIKAVSIYKVKLNSGQIIAVTNAMNAL